MRWGVIAVFLLLAASGCLRASPQDLSAEDVEKATILAATPFLSQSHGDDGDPTLHQDASLHAGSHNIERVGYSNGVDPSGDPNRIAAGVIYTELAIQGRYAYLARVSTTPSAQGGVADQTGGFAIIDIEDPENPRAAGEYHAPNGYDIEVSADGELVFFATQRNTIEELVGNRQAHEESQAIPRGVHVVDVRFPGEPTLLTFIPVPYNGPHTVEYYDDGDREFLFVQTYDFLSNTVPSTTLGAAGAPLATIYEGVLPVSQRVTIYEIARDRSSGELRVSASPVAQFQLNDPPQTGKMFFPHDVYIQTHPLRGATYMYVAYWDKGVRIVDISDLPRADPNLGPEDVPMLNEIGAFNEFSPSSRNNIHLAAPFESLIDGRHITVAEPEIVRAEESGYITFIDTSDPNRPAKACGTSYWTLPVHLDTLNFEFSPHNFDTFDDKVALAHNHAGLWILDASDLCQPRAVGFTMEVVQRNSPPTMQPWFWGVVEERGLMYAVDEASGLYILRYTGS